MKLTPFALLSLSSAGGRPSTMLGVLATSSAVKNHWLGRGWWARGGLGGKGEGALRRECGRGGEVLDESVGGEGTAGGTSRLLGGDLGDRSMAVGSGFGGSDGG